LPPWRIVYEVGRSALGRIDHVVIGPGGVYAIHSTLTPSAPPDESSLARLTADRAMARAELDEILQRCAMSSTAHLTVYWSGEHAAGELAHEIAYAALEVPGRRLGEWLATLAADRLTPAEVDLAWQTVVIGIGRPDPLY
jgi:hypothetical protein